MIRLATAHSKLRFSRKIEAADVEVARQLMLRIIDQSRTVEGEAGTELQDEDEDAMDVDVAAPQAPRKPAGSRCAALLPLQRPAKPAEPADPRPTPAVDCSITWEMRVCGRATRATKVLDDDDEPMAAAGAENADTQNTAPQVGQKRAPGGTRSRRSEKADAPAEEAGDAIMALNSATEAKLCAAIDDMLVAQRYVDQWQVDGVVRWLQEHKGVTVSEKLLEEYLDRVDQNLPEKVPHILYDLSEKTVHRDY